MNVRNHEAYIAKRKLPLIVDLIIRYFLFSLLFALIFSVILPVHLDPLIKVGNPHAFYLVLNNHFFINFTVARGDLVTMGSSKYPFERHLFGNFVKILTLGFIDPVEDFKVYAVIGIPGDVISIRDGALFVNGNTVLTTVSTKLNKDVTWYLSGDEYFIVSTRADSMDDSMLSGITRLADIEGKVFVKHPILLR